MKKNRDLKQQGRSWEYDIILVDTPPNLGLATWSVLTTTEGVIIPLEAQDYNCPIW